MDLDEFINEMQQEFADQQAPEGDPYILYTKEEYTTVVRAAAAVLVERYPDADEDWILDNVMAVLRWMEKAAMDYDLVQLILKGLIAPEPAQGVTEVMPVMMFHVHPDVELG